MFASEVVFDVSCMHNIRMSHDYLRKHANTVDLVVVGLIDWTDDKATPESPINKRKCCFSGCGQQITSKSRLPNSKARASLLLVEVYPTRTDEMDTNSI